MGATELPWTISVYKGEGRILIIPIIRHIHGFSVDSDWFINIKDSGDKNQIGNGIFEAIKVIETSSLATSTSKESEHNSSWKNNSKYKSWVSFFNNNMRVGVVVKENREYRIVSNKRSAKVKGINDGFIKDAYLPPHAAIDEIGQAVIDCFNAAEEYYSVQKSNRKTPKRRKVELLSNTAPYKSVTYEVPKDSHFIDSQDYHAVEIYKGYSYCPNVGEESIAEFYFGMGYEEDCDLTSDNIRACWEKINGKADFFEIKEAEHEIFKIRAEMINKNIHKIVYYKEFDENDIFTCEMVVKQPNRRKKTDEKLTKMFEVFVSKCRWE